MNPFEGENINSKRNDAIDAGVGFAVSFGFFTTMFIIAIIFEYVAMN
ncbi:MAG TPA: YqzM family protein [Metalysinibacillus jejuensis]|uniref:YqzM family protein n=1 Tax=Metalysinibacillus jejuensis TaxID=914327 RepID=A0A921T5L8_9BACL|nr:YqzM family protein [Metalysinibacillus jejuensis]HJH11733.1 YqzM family protein [Metalysinibacillus jejuensis]